MLHEQFQPGHVKWLVVGPNPRDVHPVVPSLDRRALDQANRPVLAEPIIQVLAGLDFEWLPVQAAHQVGRPVGLEPQRGRPGRADVVTDRQGDGKFAAGRERLRQAIRVGHNVVGVAACRQMGGVVEAKQLAAA